MERWWRSPSCFIDYGSEAFNTSSLTTKAKLDVIQAKAMRICCGAMTGTPTSALQVECGQPSLEKRRKRMMADYGIKIKCIPNHPTLETLADKRRIIMASLTEAEALVS